MNWSLARSKLSLGIAYFVAASLAVALTRYEGRVAFLWVASALLIADLMRAPRSRWVYSIVPCMVASVAATSLFGLGWKIAPFFMVLNMVEAVTAAWLFRRQGRRDRMLGSVASLAQFILAAGIVAPLVAATMAGMIFWGLGRPVVDAMIDVATGHALGNITFTPLALMFVRGQMWRRLAAAGRREMNETMLLLLLMIAVSTTVFFQKGAPLTFLPILPIIIISFRCGPAATVIAVVMLALIGGTATVLGTGPVSLFSAPLENQLQFFQFYLAATVLTILPVVADRQNRARLHREMRTSEARFRLLADHSTDILLHLEIDGRIRYVSPSIQQLCGYDPAELIGQNSGILVASEQLDWVSAAYSATVAAGGETRSLDYLFVAADGSKRWFETHARAVLGGDGEIDGVLSISRDISARKATELRLAAEAMTDQLTGLPNRRSFKATIERCMTTPQDGANHCIAVFDIDRFKDVNDRFGHDAGDAVLRTFADVLRGVVRDGDTVARVGGEEFAAFFPSTAVGHALVICDRLRTEMAKAGTWVDGEEIKVTVSGGVALVGHGGPDLALKQADLALYTAKRGGRDQMALAA